MARSVQVEASMERYLVIDTRDGRTVSSHATRRRARAAADRADNAYGGYRYSVRVSVEPAESKGEQHEN